MPFTELAAFTAGGATVAFMIATLAGARPFRPWVLAAGLSGLFLLFSVYAALTEGPFGFWPVHLMGLWGNQVWFDLLLAAATAWALLLPRARRVGMALPLWTALVLGTGSIGLLAMAARTFYLEERRG